MFHTDIQELQQNYREAKLSNKSTFATALVQARTIQRKFPNRLLCGGLALKLYGVIDREFFGDIDFVSLEEKVVPKEYITLKCKSPHKHCLFLASYVKEGKTIEDIKLQDLDQIIFWKMKFGREKDIKDLKKYHESQFITEEEFIINL